MLGRQQFPVPRSAPRILGNETDFDPLFKSGRDPQSVAKDGAWFSGTNPSPATIKLKKGRNVLLVKCHGGNDGNTFTCGITDPSDISVSPAK